MAFFSKVSGTAHKNSDGFDRQFLIRRYCKRGMQLILKPEPENPYDKEAIGLWISVRVWFLFPTEFQIGYINQELSGELSRHRAKGGRVTVTIKNVTGGTGGKNFGVNDKH